MIELAAFDLDGVLLDCPSSWEWVHRYYGVSNEDNHTLFKQGLIDDLEFIRRDVAKWKEALGRWPTAQEIIDIVYTAPVMKGAVSTLRTLKDHGIYVGIISGGLEPAAKMVAKMVGDLDFVYSNWLKTNAQGQITGEGIVRVELMKKRSILAGAQKKFGISPERTASVGDSYVDVGMFDLSGVSIAFNPLSDDVASKATYVVRGKDLRAILPFILS